MKTYEVKFLDEPDRFASPTLKVRAENFYQAVEKLRAKYPEREVRYMEVDKVVEDEVIE
jgi:hypothetical protein